MSALSIQVPFPVFQGRDGQPLKNGYVWIGEPNLNPQTNPVVAYYDKALTIIAPQPLRTLNGYVSRAGTPAQIYVDGVNFSILVQDSKGSMVYNFPDGSGIGAQASGVAFTGFKGQVGFVQDLADNNGSDWIGFQPSGTGAVARSAQEKMLDLVSVKDFGAVGDGVTDDTAAIQAAIDYVKAIGGGYTLIITEGTYRLTSRLVIDAGVRMVGEGVSPYLSGPNGVRGQGSWLHFDHSGRGIEIVGLAISGIAFADFGTFRNQPTPSLGWVPNNHDYDIYIQNADVKLTDMMLLNPTKGIFLTQGNAGRLEMDGVRGQAFKEFLRVSESYDVVKVHNFHQWPFWRDDANVHAYTLANLDAIYFERCDNPMLTNIFTIFARSGMRLGKNAAGRALKIRMANVDFDRGVFGLWVDPTVNDGTTGQFVNVTHQGESGVVGSKAVFIEGSACTLDFTNLRTDLCSQNAVRVAGANNSISLSGGIRLYNYNQVSGNFAAIEALASNVIRIDTMPDIAGGGVGPKYAGSGQIYVDEWRSYTPTVTSGTGVLTSASGSGLYKLWNDTCQVNLQAEIITNGTGGVDIRATLPFISSPTTSMIYVGAGREGAISGKQLQLIVGAGANSAIFYTYDNSYPGANGAILLGSISYKV